jgi:SAM-dependent methyltransferase
MINQHNLDNALEIQHSFNNAKPFRHVEIADFLERDKCEQLMRDFPVFQEKFAINEHGEVGAKAVVESVSGISAFYKDFYQYINSKKFLESISDMTGIPDLIADETLFGGGTHENRHGQGLDVHIDFNIDERRMLHRRLNLLIYLNPEWEESWGGLIELQSNPWDQSVNQKLRFYPLLNHALIFETNEYSWHGFDRIVLPEDKKNLSRKSFSVYLYTKDRPAEEVVAPHTTFYVPAPIPSHLKSGYTLTTDDQTQLQILMGSRDGLLKMYQKLLIEKEQRLRDFLKSKQVIVAPTYLAGGNASEVNIAGAAIRDCPVCHSEGKTSTWIGQLDNTTSAKLKLNQYELVQCADCSLVYLSPEPSTEDLTTMYVDSAQFADETYTDESRIAAINAYMSSCLTRILTQQGKAKDATISVLEVGAGLAWMSRAAKSLQPATLTVAQDISPEAVSKCNWVDQYIQGDISSHKLNAYNPFDVISMTHVIEHLVDPVAVLKRCRELLSPNGIIFITAPHRPIGWREHTRNILPWKKGSYTHVPAHIQYFSENSMKKISEVTECRVVHWNDQHEQGQAFEAWLAAADITLPPTFAVARSFIKRAIARISR